MVFLIFTGSQGMSEAEACVTSSAAARSGPELEGPQIDVVEEPEAVEVEGPET